MAVRSLGGGEQLYDKSDFDAELVDEADEQVAKAGMFHYIRGEEDEVVGMAVCLPLRRGKGMTEWCTLMFKPAPRPSWDWDGDVHKPTLHPSVHLEGHWHGYLLAGKFRSEKY